MRRYLLILLLFLVVLVTVTAGTGWYLLQDEAFVKSQLAKQTLKYTGRELTLKGPVKLELGRVTTLEANDVHFANAAWAEEPDMASAGHLKISIDLSSLFAEQIIFPALSLEDCKVSLTRNDKGEPNWNMIPWSEPEPGPPPPSRDKLPVVLREFQLQDCSLNVSSLKIEEPLDFKFSSVSMQHLESDRWQSNVSGTLNDEPMSIDGWFMPFQALALGGPLEHDLELRFSRLTAQSSGSVKDAKTWEGANLTTRIHGPDIGALLEEFRLPPFSEGPFDCQLKLNTEGSMTKLDLDGDLGSVDIKGKGELDRLINPRTGNIQFSIGGPNLGALAKVFGIEGIVEDAFSHESHATFSDDAIQINNAITKTDSDHLEIGGHFNTGAGFSGTELTVRFHSDEAGRWTTVLGQPQQEIGPLDFDAALSSDSSGLMSIKAKATQGQSTLDVEGALGHLPDTLQPDLNIVFKSPDPSKLAAIAGLQRIPAAPLTIQGRFGLNGELVQLGNVRVDLAGDLADIDGTINLSNHFAGSKLNLRVDVKNAGNLGRLFGREGLPDQPMKLGAEVRPDGKGLAFKVTDGNLGDIQLELDGRIPDLEQPLVLDGNFDINLPRLSDVTLIFPQTKLPDAPFSARGKLESRDKAVQLNNVVISLADDRATVNGLLKLENRYAGSDIRAEIDIKSLAALGSLFGSEGLPDEPVRLGAEFKPNGKGMAFELHDSNLRAIQLEITGQIADMDNPLLMDASFDVQLPNLSEFEFLFPERELPEVPFTAKGRLLNQKTKAQLEQVHMTLGSLNASIEGVLLAENRFDLDIAIAGPDASVLTKAIGQSMPADPFSVSTHVAGGPEKLEFTNLDVTLGASKADGNLTIGLDEAKKVSGNLNSPHLDLRYWDAMSRGATEKPAETARREWMFDDTPVMDGVPQNLNGAVEIRIDELILTNTTVFDIVLGITMSEQRLDIQPFTFRGLRGGSWVGEILLDAQGLTPKLHFIASGKDVRAGLAAAPGQDPSTFPPFEFDIHLNGSGVTRRSMASSLDGKIRVYVGSGQVAKAGLDLVFSDFLSQLFTQLNPFLETSEYTQFDCGVFAADATGGTVAVYPIIIHSEHITILSEGAIDLGTEKIDLSFNTKPRKGLGLSAGALINPLIKVGGRLTSPAIELDPAGTVKSTGLAVATLGISILAKSMTDRFLSSADPCGDARKEIDKRDSAAN